jgi:FeS assembly protein IscX
MQEKINMSVKSLRWTDVAEIAMILADKYPNINPINIRFTDLHAWICNLDEFNDDPKRSNEKILETIQAMWIEEIN